MCVWVGQYEKQQIPSKVKLKLTQNTCQSVIAVGGKLTAKATLKMKKEALQVMTTTVFRRV